MSDVTEILGRIKDGNPEAAEHLLPLVYDELRLLAAARLSSEKPGQTLQATALVHEAYLRLVPDAPDAGWDGRGHFFACAAEAMRRILVENARRKMSLKRGGDRQKVSLSNADAATQPPDIELLALHHALEKLESQDLVKAKLVKLRYFAGLTIPQAAAALGIAPSTADKYWAYVKAWLQVEIDGKA